MKTIHQLFFSILFITILSNDLIAQENEQLTIDLIFSGQLRQESFEDVQWMKHTNGFTKTNSTAAGSELLLYDIKKGNWETLVKAEELIPKDTKIPLQIESYSWSVDETKLLIFTNERLRNQQL